MLGVTLHPDYEENGWIYLAYTDGRAEPRPEVLTKVVRGRIRDNTWVDEETIWEADRSFYTRSGAHFGSRVIFRNGYLFFSIGDRGNPPEAQNLSSPNGNIFRLHDDGRIPKDNPFLDKDGALPAIYSYGHRNPQGLVIDPDTGNLFTTDHGPRGGDKFNLVRKGENHGWPVITYGMNYNGTPASALIAKEGMEQPLVDWTPSIAVCGVDQLRGDAFPEWNRDFFAGGLRSEQLHRLRVKDDEVVEEEIVLRGAGRIRDVRGGPDGLLYLLLNDPHKLVRLVPVDDAEE